MLAESCPTLPGRRELTIMKMADHMRRFSMPPPGFAVANHAGAGLASNPPAQPSPKTTLAQIYALAQQRAMAAVQLRQWNSLVRQLFDQ
jgi:hypothetical protein